MSENVSSRTNAQGMVWTYWVNLVVGILLFIAPLVLGYANQATLLWDNYILGALIAILALVGLVVRPARKWSQQAVLVLGVLSILSPFVLGYSSASASSAGAAADLYSFGGVSTTTASASSSAILANVILGAIAAVVAGIGMFVRPRSSA